MCADAVITLILRQHFIYCDRNEFTGIVPKPESHRRDFSVCVSAGNHLHRSIDAQDAFQVLHLFPNNLCILIIMRRTHVFKQVNFTTRRGSGYLRKLSDSQSQPSREEISSVA